VAVLDEVGNSVAADGGNSLLARVQFGLVAPFQVGQIGGQDAQITGTQIADAVVGQLGKVAAASPVTQQLSAAVHQAVTSGCVFTAHTLNPTPGTPGGGSTGTDSGSGTVGIPGTVGGSANDPVGGVGADLPSALYQFVNGDSGTVPMRNYGQIPVAMPGRFAPTPDSRYGGVPGQAGYVPSGTLGNGDDVRTAGRAVALGAGGPAPLSLPMLLAVLALSGVTAALVRTWALRRMPTSGR
jgi:hypothetical protein